MKFPQLKEMAHEICYTGTMNGTLYDFLAAPFEAGFDMPRLRTELLSNCTGKTLEVGAGTGHNFEYYPKGLEVIAIESHDSMRARAAERAKRFPNITLGSADAESLPYDDSTFDTAVATMAFCSVDDPEKALREIHRVLKPHGKLLLLEHVRHGRATDWLTPGWKALSGGCHLNRTPAEYIAKSPFQTRRRESIWKGYGEIWVLEK